MVDHAAQVMVTYGWKRAAPLAVRARELAAEASTPVRAAADGGLGDKHLLIRGPGRARGGRSRRPQRGDRARWRPTGTPWFGSGRCSYATVAVYG